MIIETKRCIIIGSGNLAVFCADYLLSQKISILGAVSIEDTFDDFIFENTIPIIEYAGLEKFLLETEVDYIFSIVNPFLLPLEIITKAKIATINFHDSLLPKYAGAFSTTWSIINNEQYHGVSWHYVSEIFDFGDIIIQKKVMIEKNETTASLNVKCFELGKESFVELVEMILKDKITRIPQELSQRTQHLFKTPPPNYGYINWNEDKKSIDSLCRALDFGVYENAFGSLKIAIGDTYYCPIEWEILSSKTEDLPGTIIEVNPSLKISIKEGVFCIKKLKTITEEIFSSEEIQLSHKLHLGDRLPIIDSITAKKIYNQDKKILGDINKTDKKQLNNQIRLEALFSDTVKNFPSNIALECSDKNFTYSQLDQLSDALAISIMKQHEITAVETIAVYLKKSWQQIVTVLSILKLGKVYVPLSTEDPVNRIENILEKAKVKLLITDFILRKPLTINNSEIYEIKDDSFTSEMKYIPKHSMSSNDIAYVIFTSGTTGVPKGVVMTHRSAANTILDLNEKLGISQLDKILGLSRLNFDLSVYDIFGIFAKGGCLVLPSEKHLKDPVSWLNLIEKHQITIWNSVPALMELLVKFSEETRLRPFNYLRRILLSGDWISPALVKNTLQIINLTKTQLISLGGATEGGIWSIHYPIRYFEQNWKSIPYGFPLSNQKIYILDSLLRIQPVDAIGEICIGGESIAQCYTHDFKQTHKKFITHPVLGKLYKTGDLGRMSKNGFFEIIGRKDTQIKVHGLRIEPTEIEYWIHKFNETCQAKVLTSKKINYALIAFIFSKETLNKDNLRQYLAEYLPKYMIPQHYIFIERWPLTLNGKIDFYALLDQVPNLKVDEIVEEEKCTELQFQMKLIWQKVLNLPDLPSIDDNFFYLGGDSVSSITFTHALNNAGYDFQNELVFRHPTIRRISEKIKKSSAKSIVVEKGDIPYYPTDSQLGIISDSLLNLEDNIYLEQFSWKTLGEINVELYINSWEQVANNTDALQIQFNNKKSPYIIFSPITELPFHYRDLSKSKNILQEINKIFIEDSSASMDVFNNHLFRLNLIKITESEHITIFSFFHAILDGISFPFLLNKLYYIYNALNSDDNLINKKDEGFKKYLKWHRTHKQESDELYWRNSIRDFEKTYLPFYKVGKVYSREYTNKKHTTITKIISADILNELKLVSREANITLPAIFQGLWSFIISYCTNKEEAVTGLVTSGRNISIDIQESVGFFLNLVPLKVKLNQNTTLEGFCKNVHLWMSEVSSHSIYGLNEIQKLSRSDLPLFDHILIFNNELSFSTNSHILTEFNYNEKTNYPLSVTFEIGLTCKVKFVYDADVFSEESIQSIINWYIFLSDKTKDYWYKNLEQIDFSDFKPQAEHFEYVSEKHGNLFEKFINSEKNFSNKTCISMNNGVSITYKELLEKVYNISSVLNGSLDILLVYLPRGVELVATILSCLQLGRPYILVTLDTPIKRIFNIAKEVDISVVVTDSDHQSLFAEYKKIIVNNLRDNSYQEIINISPEIVYVNFTSGSTGVPKAVAIKHSALVNCFNAFSDLWKLDHKDKFLAITPVSFDISQIELLLPLMGGGELFIASDSECIDVEKIASLIKIYKPSLLQTTPSRWQNLLNIGIDQGDIKRFISGGERLPRALAHKILSLNPIDFWNMYGPTETTVWCTAKKILFEEDALSIGEPISNTYTIVVNKNLKTIPPGCVGELLVAGAGIAKGYLNTDNSQSFIKLKKYKDMIFYKTGDFVIEKGKELLFHSRKDNQVKIRGQRVELGEVEAAINSLSGVEKARVLFNGEDIIAFYVPKKNYVQKLKLSLFHFSYLSDKPDKAYNFIINCAQKAEQLGFDAVWIPERHFDPIGGLFPNPAILAATLAAMTEKLHIRAGSVVLPLHETVRVAEEWAMVDNLSHGRAGVSFATGWHSDDFILAPENFIKRKEVFLEQIATVKKLWQGNKILRKNGNGDSVEINIYPLPKQKTFPIWITAAGSEETFKLAGTLGENLLTHLLIQDIDELQAKIQIYKAALKSSGFNPELKNITVMVHTFIAPTDEEAIKIAKEPFRDYLRKHFALFEKMKKDFKDDKQEDDLDSLVERFIRNTLIGSVERCKKFVNYLIDIGVTEIACLIDFGISSEIVLKNLNFIQDAGDQNTYSTIDKNIIFENLTDILPSVMIPSSIISIDEMPLTVHGKIDEKKLFEKCLTNSCEVENNSYLSRMENSLNEYTPLQKELISIFCEALNKKQVSIEDNFFHLGGHSLKAITIIAEIEDKINVKISLREFFKNSSVEKLALLIESYQNIGIKQETSINLILFSLNQESLWFLYQMDPKSARYNDSFLIRFPLGHLDVSRLKVALKNTCLQHPLICSHVSHDDVLNFQISLTEIPKLIIVNSDNNYQDSYQLIKDIANQSFDIYKALSRFVLFKCKDGDILLISIHHLVTDGASFGIFYNTLKNYYEHRVCIDAFNIEEIAALNNYVKNEKTLDYQELYKEWLKSFNILPPINYKHLKRPKKLGDKGYIISRVYKNDEFDKINSAIHGIDCTIFSLFFSFYAITLGQYTDGDSLTIGWPYANRDGLLKKEVISSFVNLLATTIKVEKSCKFSDYVKKVNGLILQTLSCSELPFSKLVELSSSTRSLSYHPLFQVVINSVDLRELPNKILGIAAELHMFDFGISRYDLELQVIQYKDKIEARFIFNADIFPENIAKCFIKSFDDVLITSLEVHDIEIGNFINDRFLTNELEEIIEVLEEKYDIFIDFIPRENKDILIKYRRNNTPVKSRQIIDNWRYIYNKLYQKDASPYAGWVNSQTLKPYSTLEMNEWKEDAIYQIKKLKPHKIFEYGAGSGLLIEELLNNVEEYYAIDFSGAAINNLKNKFPHKLVCFQSEADNVFSSNFGFKFDVVILNSVIQYFPDINYFVNVLTNAIEISSRYIFIGDVINQDILFSESYNIETLKKIITNNELTISPSFFFLIKDYMPSILNVEIQNKVGSADTEMNKYRYNCVITIKQDGEHKNIDPTFDALNLYLITIFNSIKKLLLFKDYKFQFESDIKKTSLSPNDKHNILIENQLMNIWQKILNKKILSTTDNFFDLGGNSILSIQMILRARQQGIEIAPYEFYENQTIASLAELINKRIPQDSQGFDDLDGAPFLLSPIQLWLINQQLRNIHHWNQSFLLTLKKTFNYEFIKKKIFHLLNCYDVFKIKFDSLLKHQRYDSLSKEILHYIDLKNISDQDAQTKKMLKYAEDFQRSLNIFNGATIKIVFFDLGVFGQRLLFVIHNLVMDGVSWRIFLDDFSYCLNDDKFLFSPTSTYRDWVNSLYIYINSQHATPSKTFWLNQALKINSRNIILKSNDSNSFYSDQLKNVLVIEKSCLAFEITEDKLLTAFFVAYTQTYNVSSVYIAIESHGRQTFDKKINLSRTLGWFTAIYPILFESEERMSFLDAVNFISKIKSDFLEFGHYYLAIKYCAELQENFREIYDIKKPDIVFNYFGELSQSFQDHEHFEISQEEIGYYHDENNELPYRGKPGYVPRIAPLFKNRTE